MTTPGPRCLGVTYIGHSTVLLELGGTRVLTDPLLTASLGPLRRVVPAPSRESIGRVDAIVISHLHHDHMDPGSLAGLGGVPLVVPVGAGAFARSTSSHVLELPAGESISLAGAEITAVPAVHDGTRWPLGPHAAAIGYVVSNVAGAVYFAGDTALFDGMASLPERLDVALLPVWGWGPRLRGGHLTPGDAARAVQLIKPRVAIPVHWGTYWPLGIGWYRRDRLTEPPHEFRREVARSGSATEVVVLQPGERWPRG